MEEYEEIKIRYRLPIYYNEFLSLGEQTWYHVYKTLEGELMKLEQRLKISLPPHVRDKPLDEAIRILEKKEAKQEGKIDIPILTPESQKRREIQKFIVEFIKEKGGEASLEDILEHSKNKYEKEEIMETLKRMKRAGIIYEPKLTLYKLTEGF
mgnify:CR=1 FL=1